MRDVMKRLNMGNGSQDAEIEAGPNMVTIMKIIGLDGSMKPQ